MSEPVAEYSVTETPARELTVGQRVAYRLLAHFAKDLDRGTTSEQHTAAALMLVADAIDKGYEAGLVERVRVWRREVEAVQEMGSIGPGYRKLNEEKVREILRKLADGQTHATIAKEYGVARETISKISSGDNWAWVGAEEAANNGA